MTQYYAFKDKYPDSILLFRVGDFYEAFEDDATIISNVLNIVLTKRANGTGSKVALAGFPHHALDAHLPKLIRAGYRVAICDQQETPEEAKAKGSKVVDRHLSELATPATSSSESLLEEKKNRYLAALYLGQKQSGLSLLDISTGDYLIYEGSEADAWVQLEAYAPAELICSREQKKEILPRLSESIPYFLQEPWIYSLSTARALLIEQLGTKGLEGFGVAGMKEGLSAAGAILQYLKDTAHRALTHISGLRRLDEQSHLWMDTFTVRNLELLDPLHPNGSTLLEAIDQTATPMGGRLIRQWIRHPFKELEPIFARQEGVAYFYTEETFTAEFRQSLAAVGDLERLVSKISARRALPKDLLRLAQSLEQTQRIISLSNARQLPAALNNLFEPLEGHEALTQEINQSISPDAVSSAAQGPIFQRGYHKDLDRLLNFSEQEEETLALLQKKERQTSGISSIKIGYNRIFGYYLEVRNTNKHPIPEHWTRKQTLAGAERYTTEDLQLHEEEALSIETERIAVEEVLYAQLLDKILEVLPSLQRSAAALAELDILSSWGLLSKTNNYTRPKINTSTQIRIQAGRHPVIEAQLPPGEFYVANDLLLDSESQQILLITGPNMAGKSALLRQTALIVILTQIGCFVPADATEIGLRDKIFTRVGASDNIAAGQSTFMVEMSETANILHNMSDQSLLLMDEIGRGTSTYDGLSVAWATLEYIHQHSRAPLLFATHYHELNELAEFLPRIQNLHTAVKKVDKEIVFLYTLKAGSTEQSFGIHVAQMAGMPAELVLRAEEILASLQTQRKEAQQLKKRSSKKKQQQPSLF